MILPDANLLLYAEDSLSEHHDKARTWWDGVLSASQPVNLCWPVLNAFIRIATNARLHHRPLKSVEALARVQSWFEQPCVRIVNPSENHWALFQSQIRDSGAVGGLIPDAHLAALAIEHGCTLFSADQDFAKFPALRWINPLSGKSS